jgi:hypothetical protein
MIMNNMNSAVTEMGEEDLSQLQVVSAKNGAIKTNGFSSSSVLRSSLYKRQPRPELATLGWARRAIRLAGGK